MDDSFQFIIESPQHSQGHKKRPRLVTSCDNCRLKKIKCLQPSPETKCEACKAAKIPCRFRDRERYFAERSRAIAGPNSGSYATEMRCVPLTLGHEHTSNTFIPRPEPSAALDAFSVASGSSSPSISSQSDPRSNSHSPKASGMVSADIDGAGRYPSYQPEPRHITSSSHKHGHSSSVSSFDSSRSNGLPYNFPDHRAINLFDPENPQRPNPNLMTHYINVFFERHGAEFPFLSYQDVSTDFWDQRLSSILANCIAAMSSKISNLPELSVRDLHNVAENYIDVAKNLVSSVVHLPTMETLHSIILLSWFEHSHHRLPGFRTYCGMAMKMATDLGLQDPNTIEMCLTEYERHRRRTTMAAIMQLHMTYNSIRQ
ncbi:hypothetical protein B0H34DRAFT_357108 [Crassisporium funariophilum]|nr:hypothetical protein B0H34DRAFT_357108 [Crassisporium funariophilum]